jgi:hypothetical protein
VIHRWRKLFDDHRCCAILFDSQDVSRVSANVQTADGQRSGILDCLPEIKT